MQSPKSEENLSNSGTSESERLNFKQKVRCFQYSKMPKRNKDYRLQLLSNNNIKITTNLFEIILIDEFHKFTLFNTEIFPEIANDNSSLLKQIYLNIIIPKLPKSFKKVFWAGKNLYTFIKDDQNNYDNIEIKEEEYKKNKYNIKLTKIKDISIKSVTDFNGNNLQIKSIFENLFRSLIMRNPKVITFHDRTIFEIDSSKIIKVDDNNKENIYQGYISSCHITESGLYMLINNRSKLISGKTALQKMNEMRNKLKGNMSVREMYEQIREYFIKHKTVLTTYGSLKGYKIKDVDFDKNPKNTNIKIKGKDGDKRSVTLENYYKNQYNIDIKSKGQPLLIAENNNSKKNKNDNNNSQSEDEYIIYLIPELVYITGAEDDESNNNRRNKVRNIINKTKMDPSKKMSIINNGLKSLIESENHKTIKKSTGETIEMKSPKELKDEWGINIGSNLTFPGRIISQPKLHFLDNKEIGPNNGIFRSENPKNTKIITLDNIFYIYDKNEKNSNHRKLFTNIMEKFRFKKFHFSEDFHPNKVRGYGLDDTSNWDSIKKSLRNIELKRNSFGIIFCSYNLEKYYDNLKHLFIHQYEISTQHVNTKKIEDPRRGNSIMFNLVDQINMKMGGENYYINFVDEQIIKTGQVFLVIGLDSKLSNKNITYSMSSTKNWALNKIVTQEVTCKDVTEEREKTLREMFSKAIDQIIEHCPHSPDYIIIYRQGGNEIRNKILTIRELDNFTGLLDEKRQQCKDDQKFHFKNTKLYYICCNLKSDLKFFETKDKGITKAYLNPKSGLIIDEHATHKDKYEFYLQPQYVNQGTATPCHYQVMYYDKSENEEDDLSIENLEKLSFYLSFYYWTWSGAIRLPAMLKLSNTAMGFYLKVLNKENKCFFDTPTYI